jgi:hypothetical protein
MRGPLELGIFGDGGGGESKRNDGTGQRPLLRQGKWKPELSRREANGMGGCLFWETRAAGRHGLTGPRRTGTRPFLRKRPHSSSKVMAGRIEPIKMRYESFETLRSRAHRDEGVSGRVTW